MRIAWICLIAIMLCSCRLGPPVRTLPLEFHNIHISMFHNKSYEPGLEEQLTRLVTEEFFADGRLQVVQRHRADFILEGDILHFLNAPDAFTSDEFPSFSEAQARVSVHLFRPGESEPFVHFDAISVTTTYPSNMRAVEFRQEPEVKEELLRKLAREIVSEVFTGEYAQP